MAGLASGPISYIVRNIGMPAVCIYLVVGVHNHLGSTMWRAIHPVVKKIIARMLILGVDTKDIALYSGVSQQTVLQVQAMLNEFEGTVNPRQRGRRPILDSEICQSSKAAAEHDDEYLRAVFTLTVGSEYKPEHLVFVNESSVERPVTQRTRGRMRKGERVVVKTRFSVLPALTLGGVLHVAVVPGSFNAGARFIKFVSKLLLSMNPYPFHNSVLVIDNCFIHHAKEVQRLVESRGMHLLCIPPRSSPEFNPIEEGFSAFKAWLRRNDDLSQRAFQTREPGVTEDFIIAGIHEAMAPRKVPDWYRQCGYGYGDVFAEYVVNYEDIVMP